MCTARRLERARWSDQRNSELTLSLVRLRDEEERGEEEAACEADRSARAGGALQLRPENGSSGPRPRPPRSPSREVLLHPRNVARTALPAAVLVHPSHRASFRARSHLLLSPRRSLEPSPLRLARDGHPRAAQDVYTRRLVRCTGPLRVLSPLTVARSSSDHPADNPPPPISTPDHSAVRRRRSTDVSLPLPGCQRSSTTKRARPLPREQLERAPFRLDFFLPVRAQPCRALAILGSQSCWSECSGPCRVVSSSSSSLRAVQALAVAARASSSGGASCSWSLPTLDRYTARGSVLCEQMQQTRRTF